MTKENLDKNTLGGRLKRYAKVTSTVSGLAARLAGEKYLGVDFSRENHAKELTAILGNLKGPILKVAQLLATIPEALPREYVAELQQLQSDAPSMGWLFVKRRMAAELGRSWQTKFNQFERTAAAAASLGQVHKAKTLDDVSVACKLQYPDMGSAVEADLKQLKFIFSTFAKYDKAIATGHIYDELAERLYEELDYKLESRHCQLYGAMLKNESQIHVPQIIPELSTDRLLTSTWLQGDKILNFVDSPLEQRNQLAVNLFRAWYVPLYYYGVIHGDPHPGNYTIQADNSLNLLDFGCVRVFPPRFVEGVIRLYESLLTGDRDLSVAAYEAWGFENMSNELIDILNVWAKFLYGPILEDKTRTIGDVTNGVYGRETAEKVHTELRRVGGVKVPREFVFMDRAALGLGSVFLHLKAEVNWYQMFNELIADFDVQRLGDRQHKMISAFGLTVPE